MKNKHRIKQGLSLLLAGGIALTNLGAVMPAFAEDAAATPETAEAATPESAEANVPTPNLSQITENLYNDLPDAPTGSYLGSMGLPVATGETKIGISAWVSDLYDGVDAHMDADALNADENTVTIGKTPGTDYAIVPLLAQVEYPADGAVSEIILPDGVELLSYLSTDYEPIPADEQEQAEILHQTYSEQSAAATGLYVKASADFTAQLVYTDSDGSSQSKAIQVQISEDVTPTQMYADTGDDGIAAYAAGPTPPYATGKITSIAKEGGTWLIWFNGQEAYCCSHGLNGQPKGCPTYSFSHVSRLEPGQYTPGNHYANQVNIWGGLGQLSLDMLDDRPVVASLEDDPEGCEEQPDILGSLYDETQQWIMENYLDSYAAQTYIAAAEELVNGTDAQSGENGYYTYIYNPPAGYAWQVVALVGEEIAGGTEIPDVPSVPELKYYSAAWTAPAQTAGGSFDLTFTVNTDKYQLNTLEKVDGAVITVTPSRTGGSVDGGSWQMTPAAAQTITTANSGGTLIDTGEGVVTITFGSRNADKTYATDPTGIANNEDSYTMHANADKMQNDRVLGNILLTKEDLDAARYLAAGSNGDTTLEGAVYDLYAADTIEHPDGVSGVVDYSKITDASGAPIWHTTVLTNGGWDTDYLPILQKDRLVASAQIKDGKLAFANLYMGRYYLVERATGLVLPIDGNGKLYITGKYPQLNKKLERTGKYSNLTRKNNEYTDYIYKNQYSAVAESRKLDGSKVWDGYYLSYAKGYLCDEVNHYKTLSYADESTYHIHDEQESQDEVLKSGFSLNKLVSTTGQPSPALKLEGAGFTVYRISKLSKAAHFKQNPDGSYDAASILSAYRKDNYDNATLKYDFTAEGQAIANMYESSTETVNAYNATLTADGDYANGKGNGWMPTDQPAEYRLGEMFTNDEGVFRVEGLPYGQYLVVETTIPKDVFQCDPFIVTVDANSPQSRFTVPAGCVTIATNNYMTYNVLDEELEGYLQLIKVDNETGKAVKIANTSFALYKLDDKGNKTRISMIDPASGSATKKTDVFYTDADGLMKTPEKLPLGRYLIEELQGPEGYFNDPAYSVEFEIKSDRVWQVVGNATNDMDEYIITEKYCNHETLGQLTIRKQGNVLTDYQDGQFIYTQDNLAGAVYEIHADEDIATPDRQGTYWYKNGDLVATVTTGAAGQVDEVKFSPTRTQATYDFLKITHDGTKGEVTVTLPLGKYTITEVKAPYGFILTNQSYTVEFGWNSQKNNIVLAKAIVSHEQDGDKECSYSIVNVKDASDAHKNGQTLVFENARVLPTPEKPGDKVSKIGVGIYKQDREALTYLPGAVYELYTVDDIYSADGTKLLDAGAKLAESSPTNESGFNWFDVDVPIRSETYPGSGNGGRYRIVEVKAPAGYLLDSTPVDVEFTYEGQQIAWQIVDGTNTNLRTSVDISKQDITNGKELPGAKLEICDADGNLVEGWTSTKTPHTVRGLELEKAYTLTETRAPDGYAEAESIVFKLVQDGSEQSNMVYVKSDDDWVKLDDATVIMQDAPVLDIDKTDIAGNLLPGATLTIRDANDEVVDTWTTDYKTHHVPISDDFLKLSDDSKEYIYTLTEDAAPAGFEIAESVQFKVQEADKNVCLFVRENADAEWIRADKRLIQMIDEAIPREDTPTPTPAPTPQPTPAATPAPTPAPTPHKVQTLPQTGDGFPLLAIVVVSLASATGIVLLTVKQKNALKETSDEENTDESADR